MPTENLSDSTILVHGIWSLYQGKILPYYEEELKDKRTSLYIVEESQVGLADGLVREGFELKHTTKNRRTGNKIYYYIKPKQVEEVEHV